MGLGIIVFLVQRGTNGDLCCKCKFPLQEGNSGSVFRASSVPSLSQNNLYAREIRRDGIFWSSTGTYFPQSSFFFLLQRNWFQRLIHYRIIQMMGIYFRSNCLFFSQQESQRPCILEFWLTLHASNGGFKDVEAKAPADYMIQMLSGTMSNSSLHFPTTVFQVCTMKWAVIVPYVVSLQKDHLTKKCVLFYRIILFLFIWLDLSVPPPFLILTPILNEKSFFKQNSPKILEYSRILWVYAHKRVILGSAEAFKFRSHFGFDSILFQTEPNCPIYVRYNPPGQELDLALNLSGFYCQTDVQLFQYLRCIKVKGFFCVYECVWGWGAWLFHYGIIQFSSSNI